MSHNSIVPTELNVIVRHVNLSKRVRFVPMPLNEVVKLAACFRDDEASADEFNGSLAVLLRQLLDEPAAREKGTAGSETTTDYLLRAAVASILDSYGVHRWDAKLLQDRTIIIKLERCRLGLRFNLRAVLNDHGCDRSQPRVDDALASGCFLRAAPLLEGASPEGTSSPSIHALPVRSTGGSDDRIPGKKWPRGRSNGRSVPRYCQQQEVPYGEACFER